MEFIRKEPIIFLIAGKARSGKSTVGNIISSEYESRGNRVIVTQITKYLKGYIEDITGSKIDDDNKPRELLQKISSIVIKKELGMTNFFIDRLIEDINIYSYFFDCIIITDVRFKEEIDAVKKNFSKVISIGVVRDDIDSNLTEEQKQDATEVSLDDYHDYDYKIINDSEEELYAKVVSILENI